jgi:hypothetical protein
LAQRLPSGIGDQTLITYEHGVRQLTVARLVKLCDTPRDVLREAVLFVTSAGQGKVT